MQYNKKFSQDPMVDAEHVGYEYWMMTESWKAWQNPKSQFENNAFQVNFWLHAYNLCKFFGLQLEDDTLTKIKDQILTLSQRRTIVMSEKLQPSDGQRLHDYIVKYVEGKHDA